MSQIFPEVKSTDYIYKSIFDLQDRDDAVLTMFSGDNAPSDPFQNLVWNDTKNKKLKYYKNEKWEDIFDYSKDYITKKELGDKYQPLNSNLTGYSQITVTRSGLINSEFVPVSSFYANEIAKKDKLGFELGSFADKSKLIKNDFEDEVIERKKIHNSVIMTYPTKVGDCILSMFNGIKNGYIRLSNSSSYNYTVGRLASSSTYKGDDYKNLYQFIWTKKFSKIYTATGGETSKGSSWESDWNNNKRLLLPSIIPPTESLPSNYNILELTVNGDRSGESLSIETQFNSQKTLSGTLNIPRNGYYHIIVVGGGGGSSDRPYYSDGAGYGGAGSFFEATLLLKSGTAQYNIGYGGKGCDGYARNHCGFDGSYSNFITSNVNIYCPGGYGGRCSRDGHVPSGIWSRAPYYQGYSFAPTYTINTGYLSGVSTSSNGLRQGSWYSEYGRGGDTVGGTSSGNKGNNGFIKLYFIGPEEYGTTDTNIINELNKLYPTIQHYMRY